MDDNRSLNDSVSLDELPAQRGVSSGNPGVIGSLTMRLLVVLMVATVAVPLFSDLFYAAFGSYFYDQVALNLARQAEDHVPDKDRLLHIIRENNLAWYYIADRMGRASVETQAYSPNLPGLSPDTKSRIDWQGDSYYDAVTPIAANKMLHVGFCISSLSLQIASAGLLFMTRPCPYGFTLIAMAGLIVIAIIAMRSFVTQPLASLTRACKTLLWNREAYFGVTGGALDVSLAVTEVKLMASGLKELRKQYDQVVAARLAGEDELRRQRVQFENAKQSLCKEYDEQLGQALQNLTELYTKQSEEEFLNLLGRELDVLRSSGQLCRRLLNMLNDKFPTSITHAAFFLLDGSRMLRVQASLGLEEAQLKELTNGNNAEVARQIFAKSTHAILAVSELQALGLESFLDAIEAKSAVYLPVSFQGRDLGLLSIFFQTHGKVVHERLRVLRNVAELTARCLYQVINYEEELEGARTDPVTGVRNRRYYLEMMSEHLKGSQPVSLVAINADHFSDITDTYGAQSGDQILKDLAQSFLSVLRKGDSSLCNAVSGTVIRLRSSRFLVVIDGADSQVAMQIAESIRLCVEDKTDWSDGIAKVTVSIGVAGYPADGSNADQLLASAQAALSFAEDQLGRNKVCHHEQIPKDHKAKTQLAAIGGELGAFDPAALLQSLCTAHKTGVLTVQGEAGKQFWMLFTDGRPAQARLGRRAGYEAVIDFLCTFQAGNFHFQEMSGKHSSVKLPKLDAEYDVSQSLERCLMDGALAQDHYNWAKTFIQTPDIVIAPTGSNEFAARWEELSRLGEPPSIQEYELMAEIVQRADGNTPLCEILLSLDDRPTAAVWRSAAMLIRYGLLQSAAPS